MNLAEILQVEDEARLASREVTKFLSLFTDHSSNARILLKEEQMNHVNRICRRAKAEDALMRKLHGIDPNEERKVIEDGEDLRSKLMELPHMASAMELRENTLKPSSRNQSVANK